LAEPGGRRIRVAPAFGRRALLGRPQVSQTFGGPEDRMSIGTRVMFVEGNRVTRVPVGRFDRLFQGAQDEVMPEFAGRVVHCALAYVDFEMRKPVGIARMEYVVLHFGPDGRLDQGARHRQDGLVGEMAGRLLSRLFEPVVDFGPYRAGRQYRAEFRWEPTKEQVHEVMRLALER